MLIDLDDQLLLERVIEGRDKSRLSPWEKGYVEDMANRYKEQGETMFLSPKQRAILVRLDSRE